MKAKNLELLRLRFLDIHKIQFNLIYKISK